MNIARFALEQLTRNWVLRRRLPRPFVRAPIYVSPGAGLRFLLRSMNHVDPVLFPLVQEFVAANSIVWDVGANVGLFAVPAATIAGANGRVIAFEPDTWLVQLLRRSALAQSPATAPITVVPTAVASDVGIRTFVLARRSRQANSLEGYGSTQTGGALEAITVLSVSLDWLLDYYPAPTVLKIDVEGAELEVLQGSSRLFEVARPIVIIEVGSDTAPAVTAFLREHRYELYDGEVPAAERQPVAQATWNTLAIPL